MSCSADGIQSGHIQLDIMGSAFLWQKDHVAVNHVSKYALAL